MSRFAGGFRGLLSRNSVAFSFWLAGLLIFWLLALGVTSGRGEEERGFFIGRVEVKVDSAPASEEIKKLIPLKAGEPFSLFKARQVIAHLYQTGLFSEIKILGRGEPQISLVFELKQQLYLRQVFYEIKERSISSAAPVEAKSIRPGEPFEAELLKKGELEIKEILGREGFFRPRIEFKEERIGASNWVDIYCRIIPGPRFKIRNLIWSGDEQKLNSEEKNRLNFHGQNEYNPRLLEAKCLSLQQNLRRRGFLRAEVNWVASVDEEKGEVDIEINPQLHEKIILELQGAKIPAQLITPLWEEKFFEAWALSEGEARIIRYLRRRGYLNVRISSRLEKRPQEVKVIYKIEPGARRQITDVEFVGAAHFSAEKLRQILGIGSRAPFASLLNGERVYELPAQLEAFYQTQGFPGAKVQVELVERKKSLLARFRIDEGQAEKIDSVRFSSDLTFSPQELQTAIFSQPGSPYYPPQVKLDCQRIINFYADHGFRETLVEVEEEAGPSGLYSLFFKIKEGPRFKVRSIYFRGLMVTKERTVEKELRVKESDWASQTLILESQQNLERLGIFSKVQVEEVPAGDGFLDLIFRLQEGERNLASVGVGLETKSEPRSFEVWNNVIRLRGTAEIVRANFLGDASQLSFVSQMSLKETRGVASWEQPYLFGLPLRGYLNVWLEREERISFGFDRRGFNLTGLKSLKGDLVSVLTFRYARTVLTHLEITESEVDRQFFPFSSTSISASFIRDRRDDSFNPQKGYFASAVFEWAYPLFQAEANFLKGFFKYQRFLPIAPGWNLAATFRLGLGRGRIPIHERFFAGGSNSFRGEEFDALGPKDEFSGKPVGGKALILSNVEFSFPLSIGMTNLNGCLFYDFGNVFSKRSQFSLASMKNALGVGIRYRTPLGPLRLELAWNVSQRRLLAKPLLFITIGQIF